MIPHARTTMVLQPEHEAEPNTRAEVRIYLGNELVSTTLRTVDEWPGCNGCGEDIPALVEVHATPDGLRHDGCQGKRRKPRGGRA